MSHDFTNHLHLNNVEQSKLLCRLDQSPADCKGADRRRHKRCEYRAGEIAIMVQHPGGGYGRLLVCTRNISVSGLAIIHGGYLHPGTECRLLLILADGSPRALSAIVMHCRHLGAHHHEIGLRFLEEIELSEILSEEQKEVAGESFSGRHFPSLEGSVLLVDSSTTDRRLLMHYLKATGVEVTDIATSGAAIDAIRMNDFGIVLCDINLDKQDSAHMIEQMRSYEVKCPIIVITSDNDLSNLLAVRSAGANEIIGKPYNPEALITVVAEWLNQTVVDDPIYSSVENDPGMTEMIVDFIEQARRIMLKLEQATKVEDQGKVRELCLAIQGSAEGYGFGAATTAARDVLKTMDVCNTLDDALGQIKRLKAICARLTCTKSAQPLHQGASINE